MMRRMRSHLEHHGRRIAYRESGTGRPLVWLHAFPLSADMWSPQLEAPPPGFRVIAPDLRGLGMSSHDGPTSIEEHADDVLALFDALGLATVALGGLSMGGYVAFAVLRRAPDRVHAVVLADTRSDADTPDAMEARGRMQQVAREQGSRAIADALVPRLLGRSTLDTRPEVVDVVRRTIERTPPAGIVAALECLKTRPDATPGLPFIGAPTLILVGDEDGLTPVSLHEAMRDRIPRAHLTILAKAGHLSNLEQPTLFNDAVGAFLSGVA